MTGRRAAGRAQPTRWADAELAQARQALENAADGEAARARLRRLPKADVHCHALLNSPLASYQTVLGHPIPPPPPRFRTFAEFAGYLAAHLFPALKTLAGTRAVLRAGLERMAEEGVVYTEASIDLLLPLHLDLPADAVIAMVEEERQRIAPRLCFVPEIGINRRVPPAKLWPLFEAYLESGVFGSVDLYDDERAGDLRDFRPFYRRARERGLLLKAHAGETCGPAKIRETLAILEVEVIQHGIAAAAEPRLMELLAERGVQLNLGLASNIALGLTGDYTDHPIRTLLAAGVEVALGTDDFAVFGTSLCEEILHLRRAGMALSELAKLRLAPPAPFSPP